ncbi:MAG: ATP-binding protein [Gammaproteobacteria bacterium]|nr:ATP-binding protein [Gammaproteobacteria bacterium]
MERIQKELILKDLPKKMVFLVGPRQAGKTWIAKEILKNYSHGVYLNYDNFADRKIIKQAAWRSSAQLLVLDELHKMPKWKNYLKGIYDTKPEMQQILVTGSARLDIFRQVGDSLAGRYYTHHLLPFSPAELKNTVYAKDSERFLIRGGFPEPFLAEDSIDADRWRNQYVDSLLRSDIFEFDNIENIKNMQLVFELLKTKVGSPISYKSIAEDVNIAPNTVKKYIRILESLYIVFRVTPFAKNIARSLVKEPKLYFFDVGLVKGDIGAKLENFVALCLLKHAFAKNDYEAKNYALHYLRTKDGVEVDFVLANGNEIERIFEVKSSDNALSRGLSLFQKKYSFKSMQLVYDLRQERVENDIEIVNLTDYLLSLSL